MADARLGVGAAAAALAFVAFTSPVLSPFWVALPLTAYAVLAVIHARIIRKGDRYSRAATFYERGMARLAGRWAGSGEGGERFVDPSHPYASDLDLFGSGSLFQLLSTARTHAGEDLLADWLKEPACPEEIVQRQAAVGELRTYVDMREQLAILGEELQTAAVSEPFAIWGEGTPIITGTAIRLAAAALAVVGLCGIGLWAASGPMYLAAAAILANTAFLFKYRKLVQRAAAAAENAAKDLGLFCEVLRLIEQERFTSPRLSTLRAGLESTGKPPSVRIAELRRLVDLVESRRNKVLAMFEPVVLWTFQATVAVEVWRSKFGPAIRGWLRVVAEFEALSSLANHAYEHPADPFPEFTEVGPFFQAEGLGHPFLPETTVVRNNLRLDRNHRVFVVSGSNMSGKSTLLRSVGVNIVLAQCGAPVRATRLRLSSLAVGASIRTVDSLRDGVSRFYAEIRRVRQIVDLTSGTVPILFLLDELLQGTNSHDRRAGAEAVVAGLMRRGAIGLITTHDLALTELRQIENVHFEDFLDHNEIRFDYTLRPGVVSRSNALELMRSIGLLID